MGKLFNFHNLAVASIICMLYSFGAYAEGVRIKGDNPQEEIEVTVENANTIDVLRSISKTFKFEIRGLEKASGPETYSVTFKGSLEKVLKHLLRNRNHLIVRSDSQSSGIRRIVILDNQIGVNTPARAEAIPPRGRLNAKERRRRMQFLTRAMKERALQ